MKKPAISVLVSCSIALILLAMLFVPEWWWKADLHDFRTWYPRLGWFLHAGIHYLAWGAVIAGLFFLAVRHSGLVYRFCKPWPSAIVATGKQVRGYLFSDVLTGRHKIATLFFKGLSLVYLVAFSSVLWQFALISKDGLIPFDEFATLTFNHEGWHAMFNYPSVFWISQSDLFILVILISSCILSIMTLWGKARPYCFLLQWFFYLSVVTFGRDFFHFPWDTFLLEIGFLAMLSSFHVTRYGQLPRLMLVALQVLFFRQWFSMGMTKILWADNAWGDLSFMKHFWMNQPSPSYFSQLMYKLPMVWQQTISFLTLLLEMSIPLLLLLRRRGRIAAFFIALFISFMIELNGNYGFFNLLTIVLGLWCLDDRMLGWLPLRDRSSEAPAHPSRKRLISLRVLGGLTTLVLLFNAFYIFIQFSKRSSHPLNFLNYYFFDRDAPSGNMLANAFQKTGEVISHFRIVSPHGVFKSIPKQRLHMRIQVKVKGRNWQTMTFSKGKDVLDFAYSAPNMHRLPFQFYYQVYGVDFNQLLKVNPSAAYLDPWIKKLILKIFENNRKIDALITYPVKGEVTDIRVVRTRYIFDTSVRLQPLDTVFIHPGGEFTTPLFNAAVLRKQKII